MSTPELKSTVSKVTVYTDRAMVTRHAQTSLGPKTTAIQVTQLPANLQVDSLRIVGRGTAPMTILDFKVTDQEYRDVPEAALKTLEEEKQRFHDNIAAFKDEIAALDHQKEFLKEIGVGKTKQFSKDLDIQRPLLDDWKAVLEFLGREQRDIDHQRRELELKVRKTEADIRMIEAELKKHGGSRSKTRKIVTIELEITAEGECEFELSYLIHEARWQPMYDARVDSKAKQVGIRYYGVVTQRTGEDWKGVEVLLSTARPQLGGNAPELMAWFVAPYFPVNYSSAPPMRQAAKAKNMDMLMEEAEMPAGFGEGGGGAASLSAPAKQATASVEAGQGSAVVFRTGGRGDVPGDGSDAKLLIMDQNFENQFRYLTVPKLAELVYLTADVTNGTDFPLLPGKISIFLDGNFVGHAQMKALVSPGEKFELHLGVDESIRVTRKLEKRKGDEKGLFSKSRVEDYHYKITLESHRDTAEEVVVRDHLPVSTDEKIKVETKLVSPAENPGKDKDKLANGVVEWKIDLGARKTEKLELAFAISFPRDMDVDGI